MTSIVVAAVAVADDAHRVVDRRQVSALELDVDDGADDLDDLADLLLLLLTAVAYHLLRAELFDLPMSLGLSASTAPARPTPLR